MGAFRSLTGCSPLIAGASWSYVTWTLFSPVFRAPRSFTSRRRLTPTVFGIRATLFGTPLRAPI
jgi:hypothetical protein